MCRARRANRAPTRPAMPFKGPWRREALSQTGKGVSTAMERLGARRDTCQLASSMIGQVKPLRLQGLAKKVLTKKINALPDSTVEDDAIRTNLCQSCPQHLGIQTRIGHKATERNNREHKSAREDSKLTLARNFKWGPAKRRSDSAHTCASSLDAPPERTIRRSPPACSMC